MNDRDALGVGVGPVLQATPFANSVIAAIEAENDEVVVRDEGAYLRVFCPGICRLTRAAVEAETGYPVRFPGDLEVIMSSFAGKVDMTEDAAVWWLATDRSPDQPSSA
jgi:toluene monooxygenase system protein D